MRVPLLLKYARQMSSDDKSPSFSSISLPSGWMIGTAIGAALGAGAGYFLAPDMGFALSDQAIGAGIGLCLGGVAGFAAVLEIGGTTLVVLGVLGAVVVGISAAVYTTLPSMPVAAAGPAALAALPVDE